MNIQHVIIPAAGLGTRFLPYSKVVAKELLPLVDIPAIHHIVQECVMSLLTDVLLVTNNTKPAISAYFDCQHHHDIFGHTSRIQSLYPLEQLCKKTTINPVIQQEPLGLGHAVWLCRHEIENNYCAVALPDDIITGQNPGLAQLISIAREQKASVIAVQELPVNQLSAYGVIGIRSERAPGLYEISHVIEKPALGTAPSTLAIIGRYVFSPQIFDALDSIYRTRNIQAHKELGLTDGISRLIDMGHTVYAYKISGERHDIGTPVGWIKAVIDHALRDPRFSYEIQSYIAQLTYAQSLQSNQERENSL